MSTMIDLAESCRRGDRPWTVHGPHARSISPGPGLFKIGTEELTDGPPNTGRPWPSLPA